MMTFQALLQVFASGFLMGMIYALVSVSLSLIFGLMNIVNFAHGAFLMVSMYITFFLVSFLRVDPLLSAPLVVLVMFFGGVLTYRLFIKRAMREGHNRGMVQVFMTFGLTIFLQGAAQFLFTPDYRTISDSWVGGHTLQIFGIFLSLPQVVGSLISFLSFLSLYFLMSQTDFGKALEATREDAEAVALVGIHKDKIFMMGWGIGLALLGLAGSVLSTFYYIHPDVGTSFALIAYVTVALGGFGSVFGSLIAGIVVGMTEAFSALILSPSLKLLGVYSLYLIVVLVRPRGLFGNL